VNLFTGDQGVLIAGHVTQNPSLLGDQTPLMELYLLMPTNLQSTPSVALNVRLANSKAEIKPTAPLSAFDKENSIEFPLDSVHYLYKVSNPNPVPFIPRFPMSQLALARPLFEKKRKEKKKEKQYSKLKEKKKKRNIK